MSTLFDLQNGQTFRWKDEIYRLIEIDSKGNAEAVRVARKSSDGWIAAGPLMSSNFNPYAEVEPGELTWTPD